MKIQCAYICKAGNRSTNQDDFRIIDMVETGRWMGIVCDGMGGHAMGEVASRTVVNTIIDYWREHTDVPDSRDKVVEACNKASVSVDAQSDIFNHCQMGTTMVMASIEGNKVTIANIGDSRCYLFRPGYSHFDEINKSEKDNVLFRTTDHVRLDFGCDLVSKCFISYRPEVAQPDVIQFEVQPGDRIFLCSDGVYKFIPPYILKARLMDDKSPEDLLDVIDFLCERNGDDNYTAIMAKIR